MITSHCFSLLLAAPARTATAAPFLTKESEGATGNMIAQVTQVIRIHVKAPWAATADA